MFSKNYYMGFVTICGRFTQCLTKWSVGESIKIHKALLKCLYKSAIMKICHRTVHCSKWWYIPNRPVLGLFRRLWCIYRVYWICQYECARVLVLFLWLCNTLASKCINIWRGDTHQKQLHPLGGKKPSYLEAHTTPVYFNVFLRKYRFICNKYRVIYQTTNYF